MSLTVRPVMGRRAKISALGTYVPPDVITNQDLEKLVDTNDEWIRTRTGISQRHIAADTQTTTDLAEFAARRAIADKSLDELAENIRPVGLPVGHELHPGPSWVRQPVLGGCLDLGVGFVGLFNTEPEAVVVTPQSVLDAAGIAAE